MLLLFAMAALLFLIRFLHQTTTDIVGIGRHIGCSLFDFYIKPQLQRTMLQCLPSCSLFDFYIKPQLVKIKPNPWICCSLFDFYIKPQLVELMIKHIGVVPYSISTSNHNLTKADAPISKLFLIRFLHQTTTFRLTTQITFRLFLIRFLHQTTTIVCDVFIFSRLFLIRFLHQTTT